MDVNRWLRAIAGLFIVASLALGWLVSPYFYLFTAFVGLNLLQSAFTNWCPMMMILRKSGVPEAVNPALAPIAEEARERIARGIGSN